MIFFFLSHQYWEQPTNQPTNQPTSQPINQHTNAQWILSLGSLCCFMLLLEFNRNFHSIAPARICHLVFTVPVCASVCVNYILETRCINTKTIRHSDSCIQSLLDSMFPKIYKKKIPTLFDQFIYPVYYRSRHHHHHHLFFLSLTEFSYSVFFLSKIKQSKIPKCVCVCVCVCLCAVKL